MAVTINEMEVDTESRKPQEQAVADTSPAKEPVNILQEMEKLAERELRLRAD
jgi:hypothetical protein